MLAAPSAVTDVKLWAEVVAEFVAVRMMGVVLDDGPTRVDVTLDGDDSDDSSSCCTAVDVAPLTDA
jgi:hypothetical protein